MPLRRAILATLVFAVLLYGFWTQVAAFGVAKTLGGHIGSAFTCFALLLAVLWFFGFGADEWLRSRLNSAAARVLSPATLALPYLFFSIPRHEFHWIYFTGLALLPVVCSALIEFTQPEQKFTWQDFVILFGIALVLELRLFSGAWPYPGLGSLPKLYLADVVLYVYLVVRRLDRVGYSYIPQTNDFLVGTREWAFFLPLALGLGLATGFIRFIPRHPSALAIVGALLITFLLTAIPEELFFRGILQNVLEPRLGANRALILTACLFGLSHFHKGAMFNWRYVLLASIAGIFYGRAWRARRHLFASALTHTLVDVVWSLWFR
jgi:membrane protease YdiL (CAAX protease family)